MARKQAAAGTRPLKHLLLTDCFLPHAGGSRVYYFNVYRALAAELGDEVLILTKKVPGWEEFDRRNAGGRFRIVRRSRPLQSWRYPELPKIIPDFLRAARQALSYRPDLIHAGDVYPQGLIALALKRLFGLRYLIYCHGEEITSIDQRRYQPLVRDAIYRNADAVVAASHFARAQLLRIGIPEARIRHITPGVDMHRFQPAAPSPALVERHGLAATRVILTVGRLVPRKGHLQVMKALASIADRMPDVRYVIVGTGPEEAALRAAATELRLTSQVIFAGYVPDDDLTDYYNLCDLFVLANDEIAGDLEGFGMVFLEANACGKPVIAGRSGGTFESVLDGHTGVIVNQLDPDEIASQMQRLLNQPESRERLGRQGLQRVQHEFNWHSRAKELQRVSREAAGGPCQQS